MNRLRNRLIAAFLVGALAPLLITVFITSSLIEFSLSHSATEELDRLSKALEDTGREYYQQARETLRRDAHSGAAPAELYRLERSTEWPAMIVDFWQSGEAERFALAGDGGNRLHYLVRREQDGVRVYTRHLGAVRMEQLTEQYRDARSLVESAQSRDLRRGVHTTLVVLVAGVWIVAFLWLAYLASRISRPIQQLTAGLSELAAGNLHARIGTKRNDEVGQAIQAFNHTAGRLEENRDRLLYLAQIASWQSLARKMAHELKNSLTPIRLTVEEMLSRQPESDRAFMKQAAQIVVEEIESLERRVRAFSDFSSEPEVRLSVFEINAVVEERVSLLRTGRPDVDYALDLGPNLPPVRADVNRVKGILTNLLKNAAEAAGPGGRVLSRSREVDGAIHVEVHDSGPGLSEQARRTLFEPTITFKEHGMGLGLSIARKNALVCGGDLKLVDGLLGGAGFCVVLPKAI